jgi:hypothetical protein
LWIAAGLVDPYKLAKYLGHRNPATVHLMYGHLLPEDTSRITEELSVLRERGRQAHASRSEPIDLAARRKYGSTVDQRTREAHRRFSLGDRL